MSRDAAGRGAADGARRVAAARACRSRWRPGWCRSCRRACCRWCPGYLGLRHRADRGRPRGAAPRPDARRDRACSCSGSPPSTSPSGTAVGALGRGCCRSTGPAISRVLGVVTIVLGLVFLGAVPAAAARPAARRPARRRAGRRAAARGRLRARLDGVHGPDARRDPRPDRDRRRTRPAAPCWRRPTASGSGVPFLLAGLAYRRAMGAFAVVRRHRVAVTRLGGAMLVGDRRCSS